MRNRHLPWFDCRASDSYLGSTGLPHLDVELYSVNIPGPGLFDSVTLAEHSARFLHLSSVLRDMYFDRKQRPISLMRWVMLREDPVYSRIAFTEVSPVHYVSTIWLGLRALSYSAEPIIFESMAFMDYPGEMIKLETFGIELPKRDDLAQERYCTEAQALAGHEKMVRELREQLAKTR